ncbi:MAG: 4-hydroxybenzoate octaprenyltransferase [Rhodospirillales bacterium]|nr:4-hydroxybenzoate octaprenyltransferase [Rhodospirillales bacterium]
MSEGQHTPHSDILSDDWIDRLVPAAARPYMRLARLDRPIGTWLLLLPGWWSLSMAADGWPDWWLMILFGLGAVIMRGAGCTVNDLADRNFDGKVERTATRPLPSGAVSPKQAFAFLGLLLAMGLAILLQLNDFSIILGAASLLMVAVYPFMKRFTYWPQVVLGLAFNWGALLGWAAVRGELSAAPVLLYVAGIFWTLVYDTIYAHQDKADDLLIGLRSTALRLGDDTPKWLSGFSVVALALIAAAGTLAGLAWPFYVGLAFAAGHLMWQITTVDIHSPPDCLAKFRSNRIFGWIVLAAVIAGNVAA